jgi:hypothetical protein
VAGCHETESKAKKQLSALYASERKSMPDITAKPIKAEQLSNFKWRVCAIPFYGPKKGRDTDAQYFSPRTDIKPHWFQQRPTIWHHNLDKTMKADSEIGVEDDLEMEDDGWWANVWLDKAHAYWSQIDKWLREGKMYGSSGTMGHFLDWDRKTGEIITWPHVEQTLTLTPANPYSVTRAAKALKHFEAAGITVDEETRGLFAEPDQTPDLGPTLPQGGKDPAAARLVVARIRVDAMLRRLDD